MRHKVFQNIINYKKAENGGTGIFLVIYDKKEFAEMEQLNLAMSWD